MHNRTCHLTENVHGKKEKEEIVIESRRINLYLSKMILDIISSPLSLSRLSDKKRALFFFSSSSDRCETVFRPLSFIDGPNLDASYLDISILFTSDSIHNQIQVIKNIEFSFS